MTRLRSLISAALPLTLGSVSLTPGCNESAACITGTERCGCYGNGTCEEGLVCLSAHCVDPSPERDAASDAQVVDGDPSSGYVSTLESFAATDSPGSAESEPSPNDSLTPPQPTVDDTSKANATSTPASNSTAGAEPSGFDPSATSSEATGAAPPATAATSSAALVETSLISDTGGAVSSEDTNAPEPSIPTLPARSPSALDDAATETEPSVLCSADLDLNDVCYEEAECAGESCSATLQWIWSAGTIGQTDYAISLRDLSGDGTVLFGDWVAEGNAQRNAVLLRWGNDRATLIDTSESSGTAINFDATAAVGATGNGDWTFVRWQRSGPTELPTELGTPYDISDTTTVVGYGRHEDDVLWGFKWTSGQPTYAETIALQTISGDGNYAGGVVDDGGPVVLFYANGTKSIPPTLDLVPDGTTDINSDGSVVVGYGRNQQLQKSQMFRWRVAEEEVDVVPPLGEFQGSYPSSVTADGKLVVGTNQTGASNGPLEDSEAFYWDETGGMRAMADELSQRGVDVPAEVWLSNARISDDGTTVVGEGYDGTSRILWRARLAR